VNARLSATLAVLLTIGFLAGCGNSSSSEQTSTAAGGQAAAGAAKPVDGCSLVTAAELSKAAGVTYAKIESADGGTLCNVDAASPTDSFAFHLTKEDGGSTTWEGQVATVKQDDGSATTVSGIGDHAVQGGVKEFAADAKGYIVVVLNADVNNPPTAQSFTRSKAIARLLTGKLR
jgi:hypothetical protein